MFARYRSDDVLLIREVSHLQQSVLGIAVTTLKRVSDHGFFFGILTNWYFIYKIFTKIMEELQIKYYTQHELIKIITFTCPVHKCLIFK